MTWKHFRQPLILLALFGSLLRAAPKELHHVIECSIYNQNGELLQRFPGALCVFLPDGSYVSAHHADHSLMRVSRDGLPLWRQTVQVHHQMNLDASGKRLLLLTSSVHRHLGKKMRFDAVEMRDLDGKLLARFDSFDQREHLLKLSGKPRDFFWRDDSGTLPGVHYEFSHANSIYEISENAAAATIPAFAKGGFILNVNALGLVVILDRDLKKILWSLKRQPNHSGVSNWHDVQVTAAGRLLIYDNYAFDPLEKTGFHSAIVEYDPLKNTYQTLYQKPGFAAENFGGVQRVGDHLLISDMSEGGKAFELDKSGRVLWSMNYPVINPQTGKPHSFQQIKRTDLSGFLGHNRGI
jgi:hypothetical protein